MISCSELVDICKNSERAVSWPHCTTLYICIPMFPDHAIPARAYTHFSFSLLIVFPPFGIRFVLDTCRMHLQYEQEYGVHCGLSRTVSIERSMLSHFRMWVWALNPLNPYGMYHLLENNSMNF